MHGLRSPRRLVAFCLFSVVSTLSGVSLSTSGDPAPPAEEPRTRGLVRMDGDAPASLIAKPLDKGESKRPFVVMLHGMCDTPEGECPFFTGAATEARAVVCPRAPVACPGGGSQWSYKESVTATLGDALVTRAAREDGARIDEKEGTLIGFSQGAYLAVHVIKRPKNPYRQLVLIGAKVELTPAMLEDAGVRGVVLASGDFDMTRGHMQATADRLAKKGVKARFVSLGKIGHQFSSDMDGFVRDQLAWLEKKEP